MDNNPNTSIQTFDIASILKHLPHLDLTGGDIEPEQAAKAFKMLTPFGTGGLVVGGFTGQAPWEIHPGTDELLYAVEGQVDITILTEEGEQHGTLLEGNACVIPKGTWHRQCASSSVKLLTISGPGPVSWADDPRLDQVRVV